MNLSLCDSRQYKGTRQMAPIRAASIQHFRLAKDGVIVLRMLDDRGQALAEAVLTVAETQKLSKSLALECASEVLG